MMNSLVSGFEFCDAFFVASLSVFFFAIVGGSMKALDELFVFLFLVALGFASSLFGTFNFDE